MSPKAPRPSREEVHAAILLTVREIAATQGWPAVTVREVAKRIGYTAPIIYEHFGSKEDMLAALLKEAYQLLHQKLVEAAEGHEAGEDRLRAMARAYWDYALEMPELYKLMHGMDGAQCSNRTPREITKPLVDFIAEELKQYNPGRINDSNVYAHVVEVWSILHGLLALYLTNCTQGYADGETVRDLIITDILTGLSKR